MDKKLKQAWIDFNKASLILNTILGRSMNEVGEMAEELAVEYYGGQLCKIAAGDYDLIDLDGRKIQVKSRRIKNEHKMGNLCDIRNNHSDFDILLVIIFNKEGDITLVKEYTRYEVSVLVTNSVRNNAYVITVSRVVKDKSLGKDITDLFKTKIGW